MRIRWPFHILFISIVVLCIYYPTLNAEVSVIDDQTAIAGIYQSEVFTLKNIFLPRVQGGGYYRPLVFLGYYLDNQLWGLNIRAMHLDNILLHLINVILVYFLALAASRDADVKDPGRIMPLASATVFALHPIATESVNWISGRTDPLAANFVLSAALLLLVFRKSRSPFHLVSAAALILFGTLAKETSLGMLLAFPWILYANNAISIDHRDRAAVTCSCSISVRTYLIFYSLLVIEVLYLGNYWLVMAGAVIYGVYIGRSRLLLQHGNGNSFRFVAKCCVIAVLCIGTVAGVYTVLRKIAFRSDVSKIGYTIKLMLEDTNYTISLFLGAAGFYLKKFFLPLPLNFFILEIDPIYDLLGIAVLLFCLYLMTRLTLASGLFLAGVCLFVPALPFAFGTIAWTGYAERYIYLSTAFWIVSIMLLIAQLNAKYAIVGKICRVALPLILVFLGWLTYNRNMIWQKNLTLLADTVEQSPKVAVIREIYMQALIDAGKYDLAREQYAIGTSRSIFFSEGPDLLMVRVLMKEGKPEEALALSEKALGKSNFTSERALKATIGVIDAMLEAQRSDVRELAGKKNRYESLLVKVSKDPMLFYTLGQKALTAGNQRAAINCFEKANSLFPEGSPYKDYSRRIVMRLKKM